MQEIRLRLEVWASDTNLAAVIRANTVEFVHGNWMLSTADGSHIGLISSNMRIEGDLK